MAYWEKFCHLSYWQQLTANEFNRGYLAALALVFAFLLAVLVLKFVLWIVFRTRRCGNVVVETGCGEVVISRDAVAALLRRELREFSQLEVRTIRILRRGKVYFLHLFADFHTGEKGLQSVLDDVNPRLFEAMKETFGITSVKKIKVTIEEMVDSGTPVRTGSAASSSPETAAVPPEVVIPQTHIF